MRVIAGKYRRRLLHGPPGRETRPTSDRLRETLFNILAPRLEAARFLDLCAGTGAVGIEALSRGAAHATFVDCSRRMCAVIETNLDALGVPETETEVVCRNVADYLRRLARAENTGGWDVVYFDPPYAQPYQPVLETLGQSHLLGAEGLVVAEHHAKTILPEAAGDLRRWRLLKQGDSCLSFYERS
jgi:16S rRNA (guanine(966)-N(2))-methyltransferase RsmD